MLYKVQLRQGKRVVVEEIEAKSVSDVLAFYNRITTIQVSEIWRLEYLDKSSPPSDDFSYYSLVKLFVRNSEAKKSKQLILHNVKLSVSESDLFDAVKSHLLIDGLHVDSIIVPLWKR